jgi:hypothetical protein
VSDINLREAVTGLTMDVWPNPADGSCTASFTLPQRGHVRIEIYSLLGTRVALLLDAEREAGGHALAMPQMPPPGVYLLLLSTSTGITSRTIVTR